MKVKFSIKNGICYGLNVVLKRKISRFFSSVNLAFSPLSSSEDEALLLDESSCLPTSSNHVSAGRTSNPYTARNYVTPKCRFYGPSTSKYEESGDDEMEVIKSILEEKEFSFGYGIDLDEVNIIKVLNVLYYEGGSASLSLRFFMWSEFSLGLKHTVRTVCTLIRILVLGNMNHRAVDLITCLVHGHPQHVHPNLLIEVLQEICVGRVLETVYSMLVRCYTMEDMIDEAFGAICLMKEIGIFPSAGVCNSLLKLLLDSNCLELAWNLLGEMQGQNLISASTINLFIHYYCCKGNIDIGWKLLMQMKNYGSNPDVLAYTTFIHFLLKLSFLKESTSLVFKMLQMGICPDSVLLTSIVDGYCKAARLEDAICIIKLFDVQPNVFLYNSFISKFFKDGDMEQASTVFQEMLERGILPDCFSYTTMIGGYCKASNRRKALQYLGRMFKDGIEPSLTTYTILIDSYCRNEDMDIAQLLLQNMTRNCLLPDVIVYNTLIDGYKNAGQLDKALEILDVMESVGILPDAVTYNTILHGFALRGFVSEANDLLDGLIRRGLTPDVVSFTNVIGGYSNKGQFEEAFLVWSYMSESNTKPDVVTCTVLLNGYCRACRMDEASALFHKMLDTGLVPDLVLYNTLIHGFCRGGNIEEACHLINMMVTNNISPNDATYRALILGYEKNGVTNPMKSAAYKLELILKEHGMNIDIN